MFDPPRALTPALVLAPDITTTEPKAPSRTPSPSAIHDAGPRKTATDGDPASSPTLASHPQIVPQPKHTAISPDADPANDKPPTPADKSPTLLDPSAQQPRESADPPTTSPKNLDPDLLAHDDPASQGKALPPTTIQLQPQSDKKPTTILLDSKSDENETTSGIGALIFNALGKIDPTAKPQGTSDPKNSDADPVASFPTVTVAGQLLTISDPSAVSIADTVLTPGGAEATIAGTPVSLAPSGNLVVGTGSPHQSLTILTIAGHIVTANPTSFEIAGTPVKAGEPAVTVSGTGISMGLSGDLVIGGSTTTPSPPAAVFTVGAQHFTANGAGLVESGTTVTAGGPAALISGTNISLDPSGVLIVGDITTTPPGLALPSVFTVGGETFTASPTGFSVDGTTLSAGGQGITVNSTPISLYPSGSLLIGTNTVRLPIPTPAVVTTDDQVLTVEQNGLVAVDGVTLSSGGPGTTISGTPMSVGSGGLMVGSDTIRLPTANGSAPSPVAPFTGSAPKSAEWSRLVLWVLLGIIMAL